MCLEGEYYLLATEWQNQRHIEVHPIQTPTRIFVHLGLTKHTLEEIRQVLNYTPSSPHCTNVHISHPAIPLTMKQVHSLQTLIKPEHDKCLSNPTLFQQLRVTASSRPIPCDILLYITIDNVIYTLTPLL